VDAAPPDHSAHSAPAPHKVLVHSSASTEQQLRVVLNWGLSTREAYEGVVCGYTCSIVAHLDQSPSIAVTPPGGGDALCTAAEMDRHFNHMVEDLD